MEHRRRRRRRNNHARNLRILIGLLVVLLAISAVVAVRLGRDGGDTPPVLQTQGTEPSYGEDTQPETTQPAETQPEETIWDDTVSTDYGEYTDVGTGYIAEVITYTAETFNGKTTDDYSAPIRNFLPEGTVDYASRRVISNGSMEYILLRCGRRVYVEKNNNPSLVKLPVVECYEGTLPDHNEIGFVSMTQEGHYSVLTLDVMWKAPFYLHLAPQDYLDPAIRDYRISDFTAEYVDITFCYATKFQGTVRVGADNPLFKGAKLIQNEEDCTLRLYLKKTGGFYGYDSWYNEAGQLCLKFLNPLRAAQTTANRYGADLSGIRILIDVGHGGFDGGSFATTAGGKEVSEAELNLKLAQALQTELESMGAEVILNRTEDTTLRVDERTKNLKDVSPDLCISIHQNALADAPEVDGLQVCYSTPMSHELAMLMYEHTMDAGIYSDATTAWHYYFVAKQSNCPVVLMENGYMTNAADLAGMVSDAVCQKKAQAMAAAVAEYYLNME